MKNRIWHQTTIATEEQNVNIYPTAEFDGIIVQISELDQSPNSRLYLNKDEMEFLIVKMKEMMDSVNQMKQT